MDVPEGWTPSFKKNKPDELRLRAPGDQYRLAILPAPSDGMNSEEGARMLAKKLEGTPPTPKRPGMYSFAAYSGGLRCLVVARGQRMVLIMEAGQERPFQREIGRIMHSLASTDADEQAIFDSLQVLFP